MTFTSSFYSLFFNNRRVLKPFLDKFTPLLPFVSKIAI
ncbi:hypothetical protein CCS77_0633 [Campylobacter concisus]|uniref:Uncharacterized protein n=1 Tax=Campylobacter concisus TaxID=199 RepID=A0A2R4NZ56_9BACT|nr:hypothetical protein CCS77_0633 [Campylobacter concisus]